MSIKETLLKEAKELNVSVELDNIFESVELSDETKSKFSTVFESVVIQHAVALAEKHIADLGDMAEQLAEQKAAEKEQALIESVDKYFSHITDEWMNANKATVDNNIKAGLFESLLGSLKVAFVEHNVTVPDESIDIVAELEEEVRESNEELNKTLDKLTNANNVINEMKRDSVFVECTKHLTETQKEKAKVLSESFAFGDTYAPKLQSIVQMISTQKQTEVVPDVINENLNYEEQEPEEKPKQKVTISENKEEIDPSVSTVLNFINYN